MHGSRVLRLPQPADLLALHKQQPQRYPFLLESTSGPGAEIGPHGRYDLLFGYPTASLSLDAGGQLQASGFEANGSDFLANLDQWFDQERQEQGDDLPFQGGWFLYLGYELAGQIEPVLELPAEPPGLPRALAVRCPAAVVIDWAKCETLLIAEPGHEKRLNAMADDIARLRNPNLPAMPVKARLHEEPPGHFIQAVKRIREYIRAGDVFQVNLSRLWQVELEQDIDAAELYGHLRQANPAPFSGLMRWQGTTLLSSSPERLVRSRHAGWVETRPIAGTHPRLENEADDRRQAESLLRHPKERAEHVMLLDLERNDLGRICKPGTVQVSEFMTLESYAHVHHIVSNVRGQLRADVRPGAVIRAVFPGGTITGCPKVRCMQIIAELEGEGRGAYTGSMGYLDRSGSLDMNILIRSLVLRGRSGYFRTGAGIVADSVPQRELEETRAKALGLLRLFEAVT